MKQHQQYPFRMYFRLWLLVFSGTSLGAQALSSFKGVASSTGDSEVTEMQMRSSLENSEFCCDREVKNGNAHKLSPLEISNLLKEKSPEEVQKADKDSDTGER